MSGVWFWTLAGMLAIYAALDGYDLGVGSLHLWVGRSDHERRVQLNAIGPVWNANEVWLLAAGGMMVVAFPRLYAAAFSGFYLALIVVLWLLILRGIAIEFRGQIAHPLWSAFWDAAFCVASLLLALLLGVALGNVVRGVPIASDGYFLGSFTIMLNPYAMLTGLLSVVILGWHGLNLIRTKAEGAHGERARRWSSGFWWAALALAGAATVATLNLRGNMIAHFNAHPAAWIFPLLALTGFAVSRRATEGRSFAGSTMVILGLLGAAAMTLYPVLLPSTLSPDYSLTITNSASGSHGLLVAWLANISALCAVAAYSTYVHRAFRGKVRLGPHSY
ncbi:MAG TPA: cytochrome d ubiquinol oxidase subunit II [Terriglobales bacterium]|nr:cytochrome d ubiquinol oxidase subunit II [Terriglobales bacterium]